MQCRREWREQEHGSRGPQAFEDVVVRSVSEGEKIVLSGFLSFERVDRKARTAATLRRARPFR